MEKVFKTAARAEAVAPNAVAGSCPECSPVPLSDNEMHPEPAAASPLCRPITPEYAARFAGKARSATTPQ